MMRRSARSVAAQTLLRRQRALAFALAFALALALALAHAHAHAATSAAPPGPPVSASGPPSAALVKVACIGDSITAGTCSWGGYTYPRYVQLKLGAGYDVANFGVSGRTMLKKDANSYWNTPAWAAAQNFSADVYTIMLGTNDAKSGAWLPCAPPWLETCRWEAGDNYTQDFLDMISTLRAQPQRPRVFVLSPPPVYADGKFGINQTVVNFALPFFLADVASNSGAQPTVVPVFEALGGANLTKGQWTCDGIHPNDGGYEEIGNVVSAALIAALGTPAAAEA
jgi:acyl-CoA thioesterase-1